MLATNFQLAVFSPLLFTIPLFTLAAHADPAEAPNASYVTHAVGAKKHTALPVSTCEQVNVHVRTILGVSQSDEGARKKIKIDKRIKDLKKELRKLPFQQYQLLADRSAIVPLLKRKSIQLSDGHRLMLRPLYANNERVGVWIKWKDRQGMQIIDTRLHFNCDEPMLTGMEMNEDRGLILAVNVKPEL